MLGISERTCRRWRDRYDGDGLSGLFDRRLGKASAKQVALGRFLARPLAGHLRVGRDGASCRACGGRQLGPVDAMRRPLKFPCPLSLRRRISYRVATQRGTV